MLTFIYASRLVTGGHGRKKRKCQADDAPKKSSCGKFQNPNFDNEGIKIDMAPQRDEHFQEGRMLFVPRLSEGRAPCSVM